MKLVLKIILFVFILIRKYCFAGTGVKQFILKIYLKENFKNKLVLVKIQIIFFLAIHTSYNNSGHLLNSLISELCDLRRNIVSPNPVKMIHILLLFVSLEDIISEKTKHLS